MPRGVRGLSSTASPSFSFLGQKVLYVRNLMVSTTEEQIRQKFVEFGKLEKVKKIHYYAFVHYSTREDAVAAKESMDGK